MTHSDHDSVKLYPNTTVAKEADHLDKASTSLSDFSKKLPNDSKAGDLVLLEHKTNEHGQALSHNGPPGIQQQSSSC